MKKLILALLLTIAPSLAFAQSAQRNPCYYPTSTSLGCVPVSVLTPLPVTPTVAATAPLPVAPSAYPSGATAITASSGNVAAATATATLPAVANQTTYLCGAIITSAGSTAASVVSPTITNIISGTMTFTYASIAGATLANQSLIIPFRPCIPASAVNTTIAVTLPSLGAGNTNATVSAWGYQQ